MYDAREKEIRDQQWALNESFREGKVEGKIEGEIKLIQTLQEILEESQFEKSHTDSKLRTLCKSAHFYAHLSSGRSRRFYALKKIRLSSVIWDFPEKDNID